MLDINQIVELRLGVQLESLTPEVKDRAVKAARRWLARHGLEPVTVWDESAVRAELARDVPRGLAAADPETRARVSRARHRHE